VYGWNGAVFSQYSTIHTCCGTKLTPRLDGSFRRRCARVAIVAIGAWICVSGVRTARKCALFCPTPRVQSPRRTPARSVAVDSDMVVIPADGAKKFRKQRAVKGES
jgi:hypothetical protein